MGNSVVKPHCPSSVFHDFRSSVPACRDTVINDHVDARPDRTAGWAYMPAPVRQEGRNRDSRSESKRSIRNLVHTLKSWYSTADPTRRTANEGRDSLVFTIHQTIALSL